MIRLIQGVPAHPASLFLQELPSAFFSGAGSFRHTSESKISRPSSVFRAHRAWYEGSSRIKVMMVSLSKLSGAIQVRAADGGIGHVDWLFGPT